MKLDKAKAYSAIEERIARPQGIDVIHAAAGIKRLLDSQMADLLRSMTIASGYDPRDFVLFAFGGAGPTHCSSYGAELNVKSILVPVTATVHCAFGMLVTPILHSFELSDPMRTPPSFGVASKYLDCNRISANFGKMEERGRAALKAEGIEEEDMIFKRSVDGRYRRQVNELAITIPNGKLGPKDVDNMVSEFERLYAKKYGPESGYREAGIEFVTFRLEAIGKIPKPTLRTYQATSKSVSKALIGERRIYFYEIEDFAVARIYDGSKLGFTHAIGGPAVIQYPGTTVLIGPDQTGTIDRYLNVVIERK